MSKESKAKETKESLKSKLSKKIAGSAGKKGKNKDGNNRISRILGIYTKLMNGGEVSKSEEAQRYGVNEKSIQRDLGEIKDFLKLDAGREGVLNSVVYDRKRRVYHLERTLTRLTNSEIFTICKILLDSRALTKKEMEEMLDKLIECCVPKNNQKLVSQMIRNEKFHYIELQHKTVFKERMWELAQVIQEQHYITIDYQKMTKELVKRRLMPVAIMFSEFYFYLLAFIADEKERKELDLTEDYIWPTIYRIDRIKGMRVEKERFHIPYASRFEEGEFRKRVQFMYVGKLQRVKFWYKGDNIEAVLDRLPTAKVLEEKDGKYLVTAEVFGKGIDMWLRSQGEMVEVVR